MHKLSPFIVRCFVVLMAMAAASTLAGGQQGRAVGQSGSLPPAAQSGLINVQTCGAKGDGVSDDTSALQSCIDQAKTQHRSLYLPTGAYRVSRSLNVTVGNGLFIYGDGADSFGSAGTIIVDALTEPYAVIDFSGCMECGLEKVTIATNPNPAGAYLGSASTSGVLVSPGPVRPVDGGFNFLMRDVNVATGVCWGCASVAIVGSDWPVVQNYLGGPVVMGYSLGRSIAVRSKFYDLATVLPDSNPTMGKIIDAQFSGDYVPALQLTGSQYYVIDNIDLGLSGEGRAGTMMEVTGQGSNGIAENVIHAVGLRTENFSTHRGAFPITFAGQRSTGGYISGNLCTDGDGRVLRVEDAVYVDGYDTIADYCEAVPFFSIGKNAKIWNDTFRIGQGILGMGEIDPTASWIDSNVRVAAWERFDVQKAVQSFPVGANGMVGTTNLSTR